MNPLRTIKDVRLAAREWLIANDPEGADYWSGVSPAKCLAALRDNVRDFGPDPDARTILLAAKRLRGGQ